jgi:hypothetical protein
MLKNGGMKEFKFLLYLKGIKKCPHIIIQIHIQ